MSSSCFVIAFSVAKNRKRRLFLLLFCHVCSCKSMKTKNLKKRSHHVRRTFLRSFTWYNSNLTNFNIDAKRLFLHLCAKTSHPIFDIVPYSESPQNSTLIQSKSQALKPRNDFFIAIWLRFFSLQNVD